MDTKTGSLLALQKADMALVKVKNANLYVCIKSRYNGQAMVGQTVDEAEANRLINEYCAFGLHAIILDGPIGGLKDDPVKPDSDPDKVFDPIDPIYPDEVAGDDDEWAVDTE